MRLGYHCALESGDPAVADAWLAYDTFRPPLAQAGPHLQRRYEAESWGATLALLERTVVALDPVEQRSYATLRLDLLLRLGRLDETAALATTDLLNPDARVFSATQLAAAGRVAASKEIAARACPEATEELRAWPICAAEASR